MVGNGRLLTCFICRMAFLQHSAVFDYTLATRHREYGEENFRFFHGVSLVFFLICYYATVCLHLKTIAPIQSINCFIIGSSFSVFLKKLVTLWSLKEIISLCSVFHFIKSCRTGHKITGKITIPGFWETSHKLKERNNGGRRILPLQIILRV